MTALITFDTETSGVSLEEDRILTANITALDSEGNVVEERNWILNPGIEVPKGASDVNGLTTEFIQANGTDSKIGVNEIGLRIQEAITAGIPVVAYNAVFDLTLLDREYRRLLGRPFEFTGIKVIDPMVIDRGIDKYRKGSRKLVAVAEHYGIKPPEGDAHEARYDAILAGRLALHMLDELDTRPRKVLGADNLIDYLQERQIAWHRDWAAGFQEYLSKKDPEAIIDGDWPYKPLA